MGQKQGPNLAQACLGCVDCFLILFVLFPLAIFHWRGTWDLLDLYIVPNDLVRSSWVGLALGINCCIWANLLLPVLKNSVASCSKVGYVVLSRLFMYILGWGILCFWRGLWNLLDYYLTEGWVNSIVCYAIAQIFTLVSCTSRTNCGIPVNIVVDTDPDLLSPSKRFDVSFHETTTKYVLDTLLTQVIVVGSNVVVWRGIWNILDAFLYPHDHLVSDLASLAIGLAVIIFLFIFQVPASLVSAKLDSHPILKIIFEDFLFLIATWGNLFLWRGCWDLCVAYILPGNLFVSGWTCHFIGSLGLLLLQGFANVGSNMTDIDGTFMKGEGLYPLDYIRSCFNQGPAETYKLQEIDLDSFQSGKECNGNLMDHEMENGGKSEYLDEYLDDDQASTKLLNEDNEM